MTRSAAVTVWMGGFGDVLRDRDDGETVMLIAAHENGLLMYAIQLVPPRGDEPADENFHDAFPTSTWDDLMP